MSIAKSVKAVEVVALEMDTPVVVEATMPLKDALRLMREGQCGCALICRDGKLCGIFTERDVLNKVVGVEGVLDQPVSNQMTPDPVCVEQSDPIRRAVLAMYRGGFRSVPVVDSDGKVVSCVRHKDIIHFLVEHYAQHVLNLPPDPENVPTSPDGG
jgi:CBS domain-containing protein